MKNVSHLPYPTKSSHQNPHKPKNTPKERDKEGEGMMISTKPMSSPSRTEKFPPPPPLMMRFLRSNVGGRSSKGKSRSSAMFILRKKNNNAAADTHEPSSPKVTCIGQVRPHTTTTTTFTSDKPRRHSSCCRCLCLQNTNTTTLSCPRFLKRIKSSSCSGFRKWVRSFRVGGWWWCCGKAEVRDQTVVEPENDEMGEQSVVEEGKLESCEGLDSCAATLQAPVKKAFLLTRCRSARKAEVGDEAAAVELEGQENNRGSEIEEQSAVEKQKQKEEEEEEIKLESESESESESCLDSCTTTTTTTTLKTPPKNAFLLTRCRSASYISNSSLANRFWDNNNNEKAEEEEEEERETTEDDGNGGEEVGERERPTCEVERDGSTDTSVSESRIDEEEMEKEILERKLGEIVDSVVDGKAEEIRVEEVEKKTTTTTETLLLTRCKSEPARRGERLNPAAGLWRERETMSPVSHSCFMPPASSPRVSE